MKRHVLLAALLLASAVFAQSAPMRWTQFGGDAARSRELPIGSGPLDVLATGKLVGPGQFLSGFYSALAVDTTEGTFALQRAATLTDDPACSILRVRSFAPLELEATPIGDCGTSGRLVGVHEGAGLLLASTGGAPEATALVAYDLRTLEERWRVGIPADVVATPSSGNVNSWRVRAVIEQDRCVVSFSTETANAVVALDLDGRELWSTHVPASRLVPNYAGTTAPLGDPTSAFGIDQLTGVDGGYFAWGSLGNSFGAAWLDRDGTLWGGYLEGTPFLDDVLRSPGGAPASGALDAMPTGQGEVAVMVLDLYLVSARATDERAVATLAPVQPAGEPLVWWRDALAMPTTAGVTVLRTPSYDEPWSWKPPRTNIEDMAVSPDGRLLVLSATVTPADVHEPTLSWLDLVSRREVRRIPLPGVQALDAVDGDEYEPQLVPLLDGRVVVLQDDGRYTLLGASDPALGATIQVSDAYPPQGSPVGIEVRAPEDAALALGFGDGTFEPLTGAPVTHAYPARGKHIVSATALYPDGRTATSELVIDVGGTPPAELNAIQVAFSDDNQELTFFLLGIALTGGGALFAALLRRRRHSRLTREEALLRHIIDESLPNPTTGLARLEAHRGHLRDEHARRRLDDAQYGLLDHRTVRAMKSARYRLLGSALNKLSPHFRRLLDTALEDGQVTTGEMAALVSALEDEGALSAAEKGKMRDLLAGWAR